MKYISLLMPFAFALNATAQPDTLYVSSARKAGQAQLFPPYQTDSTTLDGKPFVWQDYLNQLSPCSPIEEGDSLVGGAALEAAYPATLRWLQCSLSASAYSEAQLHLPAVAHYKAFLDDVAVGADGKLRLTPGSHKLTLAVLSDTASRDTFRLFFTGKDLSNTLRANLSGKRPYDLHDIMTGPRYARLSLSPSGRYLFTVYSDTQDDGRVSYRTVLEDLEQGTVLLRRNDYFFPTWLDNEDRYYDTRESTSPAEGLDLLIYDPATAEETLIASALPKGHITLSPKLDYVIIDRRVEGGTGVKGALKRLQEPDDRQPAWRDRNALYRYDVATGVMQPLTFGNHSIYLQDISPDGGRLLLSVAYFDATRRPFNSTTLVTMDAYSGQVDTIMADTAWIGRAQFSPDGKQLLVQASPAAFDGIGLEVNEGQTPNVYDTRLFLYDLASGKVAPLLPNFRGTPQEVEWNPSDNYIYMSAEVAYDKVIYRLDPSTLHLVRYDLPVTYVQSFSLARGKKPRIVFTGQTGERAREAFLAALGDKPQVEAKRTGEIDFDELYKDVAIGKCREWSYQGSRGDTLVGFYHLPPDFDPAKKYPVIVYYYGGCSPTARLLEFRYPLAVFAGQGYVALALEPSGATGFTQEFGARHVNTWGMMSADDIIDGTKQFLAEHPWADAEHVGCMGASYGGFMTQYLQTRTDIFAAAVSHAGISNIASYWGGGYWGYSYGEAAQYGSFPWNNPDLYVKQSALFNADKIHTPLLLLHGTDDTNVPPTESLQLYTALKILGREVELIQVEGENHVIMDFNKRIAWQNAIFAWFAKYLKGEPSWWEDSFN